MHIKWPTVHLHFVRVAGAIRPNRAKPPAWWWRPAACLLRVPPLRCGIHEEYCLHADIAQIPWDLGIPLTTAQNHDQSFRPKVGYVMGAGRKQSLRR